jgi:hypothetical protein
MQTFAARADIVEMHKYLQRKTTIFQANLLKKIPILRRRYLKKLCFNPDGQTISSAHSPSADTITLPSRLPPNW